MDDVAEQLDQLVARLDGAMIVVTAAAGPDGEADGCLVGFHSQASIDPRRYVVWLSVANRTYRVARSDGSTHLAVHVLSASDRDLAERFGGTTADEVDKLADLPWTAGPGGVPVLDALPERFVGRIVHRIEEPDGDHVGFVLEPVVAEANARAAEPPLRLGRAVEIEPGHPA